MTFVSYIKTLMPKRFLRSPFFQSSKNRKGLPHIPQTGIGGTQNAHFWECMFFGTFCARNRWSGTIRRQHPLAKKRVLKNRHKRGNPFRYLCIKEENIADVCTRVFICFHCFFNPGKMFRFFSHKSAALWVLNDLQQAARGGGATVFLFYGAA